MDRIPILRMGDVLLVSIQIDMQDQTALALQDDLAERIASTGASGVMIDISALEVVDSFVGRMLVTISGIARILSAATVVVGMQPAVAITLVELGLSLGGVRTAMTVERGMALLRAQQSGATLGTLLQRPNAVTKRAADCRHAPNGALALPDAEVLAGRSDKDDYRCKRAVPQYADSWKRWPHELGHHRSQWKTGLAIDF